MPNFSDLQSEIETDLYRYVKLVHFSPVYQGYEFNPVALIRGVNNLLCLGKERALAVLRRYVELCVADYERSWEYGIEPKRIVLILHLLFVRYDGNPQMPKLRLGQPDVAPADGDNSWPLFPLWVEQQIHFFIIQGYDVGGRQSNPFSCLDYYQQNFRLRDRPLVPETSPIVAVESLLASERFQRLILHQEREIYCIMLYRQSLLAMAPLYAVSDSEMDMLWPREDINVMGECNRHARAINQLSPRWNSSLQQFVSG